MTQEGGQHNGNALSEYGLLLGLITVLSVGALNLLGGSLSGNLDSASQGNAANAMQRMTRLDFSGDASNTSTAPLIPVVNLMNKSAISAPSIELNGGSSGGTNATSIAGADMINQVLNTAEYYSEMALTTDNPALRDWYRQTAEMAFKMASSQAAYEMNRNPNATDIFTSLAPNSKLGEQEAFTAIEAWERELYVQRKKSFEMINAGVVPPAEMTRAREMLDYAIGQTNNIYQTRFYANTVGFETMNIPNSYNPNTVQIRQSASSVLKSGVLTNKAALSASLNAGLTLDSAPSP